MVDLVEDVAGADETPDEVVGRPSRRRTFDLSREMDDFADRILEIVLPRCGKGWRERISRLWAETQARFADKATTTQKLYGSKFRKAAREAIEARVPSEARRKFLLAELRPLLATSPALLAEVNSDYRRSVGEQVRDLALVEDWPRIIAGLRGMLERDDPRALAVALMGLTGRRFYEVLSAGTISPIEERMPGGAIRRQKWVVDFEGQLKTRGAPGSMAGEAYPIPLLAPARPVLAAWARLRATPDGASWASRDAEGANSAVNPLLNRYLREETIVGACWPHGAELTLKSLRALYAEIAYHHFAPPSVSKSAYFALILGHGQDDLTTALSYMRYHLDPGDGARREVQRVLAERERQRREREAKGLPVTGN